MLRFDAQFADMQAVGPEHGLDLATVFKTYAKPVAQAISQLYANKSKSGGWSRWLELPYDEVLIDQIEHFVRDVKGQFSDLVILGIGGSSLGGFSVLKALLHPYWNQLSDEQRQGYPRFHFIENVDADQINALFDVIDLKRTLVNVITKSGTTAETMSAFMLLKQRLEKTVMPEVAMHRIVCTTDRAKGILRSIAQREGYTTFEVPDDVGGRFSVFSAVGLLPAALCGIDIRAMQQGLRELDTLLQNPDIEANPAAQNAVIQVAYYLAGKEQSVFMPYSARLAPVALWYVQLWAESLGKKHNRDGRVVNVGPTPLPAVGVTDQHSQVQLFNEGPHNKVITFVEVETPDCALEIPPEFLHLDELSYLARKPFSQLMQAEFESTRASLAQNHRPSVTLTLPKIDAVHVGQLLYFLEVQTAVAGALLNIDPFDQPGVELAKQYTYALMGKKGSEGLRPFS